ncbi:MAG: dTDP-4-dehydrorhamnose reductase [Muribaculaceae bacterium]|nr:dTDP-4-dehydrorhamnose reductase [Muribaculaceae bacterium]
MRILVTGANGQLGNCIRNAASVSSDEYIFTDVDDIDITDPEAVDLGVSCNNIDVIVNCAAYTNVDKAEEQPEFAEILNAGAVRNLALAAKKNGATLIHISTDYVFGGNSGNTPRSEEEPANPTGVYGLTKLHGEHAALESGANVLIFRTAWLYSEYGKNFVKTMLNLTATKPALNVVFDQVGSPTYAQDLADAIVTIISERKFIGNPGIYNYSNEGVCSWFDFTKHIAEIAGNDACDIQPCHSDEFPSPVVRPSFSVLDKTKVKTTFGIGVPYWVDSLRKCIKNIKENEA